MTPAGETLAAVAAACGGLALVALRSRDPRRGAGLGLAGLLVVLVLARALPGTAPAGGDGTQLVVEAGYLRSVTTAFALTTGLAALTALASGVAVRVVAAIVATSLLGLAAAVVTLGAADPVLAGLAALAGAVAGVGLGTGAASIEASARELRVVVIAGAAVVAGAAVAPALGAPVAAATGTELGTPAPLSPAVGAATLVVALGAGLRYGAIPFHLWVARAADAVHPAALPLVLGWLPMLVGAAAAATVTSRIAPLGVDLAGERLIIAAFATLTLLLGPLAAWIQEDLDHLVGYVAVATAGIVLLGLAAFQADAWPATRLWLVAHALAVTALAAWVTLIDGRYGTRRLPELDGWARRSPLAALGLVLAALALVGLPGWANLEARRDLAELALGTPLGTLVGAGSLVVVAPLVRVLVVGARLPSPRVSGAPAELGGLGGTRATWRSVVDAWHPATRARGARSVAVARAAATATAGSVRANAPLTASVLLTLTALVGLAIANGGLDLATTIAEPAPAAPSTAG